MNQQLNGPGLLWPPTQILDTQLLITDPRFPAILDYGLTAPSAQLVLHLIRVKSVSSTSLGPLYLVSDIIKIVSIIFTRVIQIL